MSEPAACVDGCLADKLGLMGPNMRSDALRAYANCKASIPCDRGDDDCTQAMFEAIGLNAATLEEEPEVAECVQKGADCDEGEDSMIELCSTQMILATPARRAFMRCFSEPCEARYACAERALYGTN